MHRRLATFFGAVLLIGLVASQALAHDEKVQAQLIDEVLRMTEAGVPEDIILKQITAWGFEFELSADDIVELRSLGVSDAVVAAMVDTGATAGYEDKAPEHSLHVSAGFYSPWYCYPYAWSLYYDPFPWMYSAYYYPVYYHAPYFGHYGWSGCTYYSAYHRRLQPRPGAGAGGFIGVATHLPAQPAPGVGVRQHAPSGLIRPGDATRSGDPRRGWIASRRSRQLAPGTSPYGSRRANQPAFGGGRFRGRQGSVLTSQPGRGARQAGGVARIERGGVLSAANSSPGSWIPLGAGARSVRDFTSRGAGSSLMGARSFAAPRGFQQAPRMAAPAFAPVFRGRGK
jgi:hypothetical protein